MTKGFRRTPTGRITIRLSEFERDLVASLARQLLDVVQPPPTAKADPLAVELGLEDLDTAVDMSDMSLTAERDPLSERLFPSAYEDESEALEFRRFTEIGLRQQKSAAVNSMLESLTGSGDKVTLNQAQAGSWVTALNDIRLALSVRLEIKTASDLERFAEGVADEETAAAYEVYEFLTFLQASLVEALT